MKVILFTHDDPIYMPRYLEPIVTQRTDRIDEIILAPMDRTTAEEIRIRYQMFGPRAFARFALKYAMGKALDRLPSSTTYRFTGRFHSVRSLASSHDVPIRLVHDINEESFVTRIAERDPDLFLSVACGQIMGEKLLDIPSEGAINIHGSLLPEYRGLSTAFWVLYHDESVTGVTAHYMDSTLDTGSIIEQRAYPIQPDDSMHDLYLKLTAVGARLANDVIDMISDGTVDTKPNDPTAGEYFSRPTAQDRRVFLERGNEFI